MLEDIPPRDIGCFVIAAILVILGTAGSAFLPPTTTSLVIAGGLIVAGFAVVFLCFW